jgi:hypothetical protein
VVGLSQSTTGNQKLASPEKHSSLGFGGERESQSLWYAAKAIYAVLCKEGKGIEDQGEEAF